MIRHLASAAVAAAATVALLPGAASARSLASAGSAVPVGSLASAGSAVPVGSAGVASRSATGPAASATVVAAPAVATPPRGAAVRPVRGAAVKAAPFARLTLTVTSGEVARRSAPVTLTCGPAGGTHPTADAACKALQKSGGQVFGLPPREGVLCTADYRPVTASATGYWGKRQVKDTRTFGNACQLGIVAGAIFTPAKS